MSHPRALIFDLDGTLVDSAPGICASCQAACVALGYPVPTDEVIRPLIGLPVTLLARTFAGDEAAADQWVVRYRSEFDRIALPASAPFPGVVAALERWRADGRRLAVATSKRTDRAVAVLRQARLLDYFEVVVGGDQVANGKPAPDIALRVLSRLGVGPCDAALVGDTAHDIEMARGADVPVYAVTYGVHERAMLEAAEPTAIVDRFADLAAYLG